MRRGTWSRTAVTLALSLAALAVAAPASARYGDVSVSARTVVNVEAFGDGVPAGFAEFWNESADGSATGVASSSYAWPAPIFDWVSGLAWTGCPETGCASKEARAHASVDRGAGELRAAASGKIMTGGFLADNAGYNQTRGEAELEDTITLSTPASVVLEGSISGRLGFSHSHSGWYGDPRARLRANFGFTGDDPEPSEWPFVDLGGFDEEYQAGNVFGCPYPSTCALPPGFAPSLQTVSDTFSIEVDLPAGTSYFTASLIADIDMLVWGAQGDEHRSMHSMSALVDFANTVTFRIVVPEGVVATSGSGDLPIVGGSAGEDDTDAPELSCDDPPSGWQPANVTVACTASDAGSGLADEADASFSLSTSVAPGEESATAATDSREVCDAAGNCATAGPFVAMIDRKAPSVVYSGNAGSYELMDAVSITCSASDGGSGVVSDTCAAASGPAYAFGPGETVLTATATDAVGNTGHGEARFTVIVTAEGLEELIDLLVANRGVAQSLKQQLRNAPRHAFERHLRAQIGKSISTEDAELLLELAEALQ